MVTDPVGSTGSRRLLHDRDDLSTAFLNSSNELGVKPLFIFGTKGRTKGVSVNGSIERVWILG